MMQNRALSILVSIALLLSSNYLVFSQAANPALSTKDMERIAKVKKDLDNIGVGKTITVSRIDDRDFFGRVKTIGTDDFEIIDSDSKQIHIFKYVDIKNVRSGDGKIMATGRRRNNRSGKYIALAVAGGLIAFAVIAAKSLK